MKGSEPDFGNKCFRQNRIDMVVVDKRCEGTGDGVPSLLIISVLSRLTGTAGVGVVVGLVRALVWALLEATAAHKFWAVDGGTGCS